MEVYASVVNYRHSGVVSVTAVFLSALMSRHLLKLIVFSVISLSFVSCSGQKGADPSTPAAAQGQGGGGGQGRGGPGGRRGGGGPVPVVTARVQSKSVPVTIPAVGTAEP